MKIVMDILRRIEVSVLMFLSLTFAFSYSQSAAENLGSEIKLPEHFMYLGVSFNYPTNWTIWEKDSFNRARSFLKPHGVDLIAMFKMKSKGSFIQLTRSKNPSSFESFYQDKKQFARQVTTDGVEIEGSKYVKYYIKVIELIGGQKAIFAQAEKSNGETGISYQILLDGYEYNVNFIYQNIRLAAKDEKLREQVMLTFNIAGSKD